jgi:membrane protease YdiL (CAAX protease family)
MSNQPVIPANPTSTADPVPRGWFRRSAISHPILLLLAIATPFVWVTQMASAVAGLDLMPAKLAELILLVALAVAITRAIDQRAGVRQLFAGLLRWRLGWRYVLLVVAMPVLTAAVAMATGSLHDPAEGWPSVALKYAFFLVVGAVTANLWEETVWGGFVQARLMARHGLLTGSLLTAVPVFLIHLPLAFEMNGWHGTSWQSALISWGVLLVAAPFQRYLIGTLLVDARGSTLAAGLMHASINAAGAMAIVPGGWQLVPALILLTLGVAAYRRSRGLSATDGYAPEITPPSEAAERTELGVAPQRSRSTCARP